MNNKILKSFAAGISIIYLVGLCALLAIPYWPVNLWWLANFIGIIPLWIFGFPIGFLLLIALIFRAYKAVIINLLSCLILFIGIMGFNVPSIINKSYDQPSAVIRVMTVNMGAKAQPERLLKYIGKTQPDLIAFQELDSWSENYLKTWLPIGKWDFVSQGNLGLASRFKIKNVRIKDRKMLGGWGTLIAKYEVQAPMGVFYFFDLHLATPREGVDMIKAKYLDGIPAMKDVTEAQDRESAICSAWVNSFQPILVAGDFNMLKANPLFRKYWSKYTDGFAQKGFGFGYTKFTRWHGVRIDHILSDANWQVVQAQVGEDTGGDHRPIIVDLKYIGKKVGSTPLEIEDKLIEAQDLTKKTLVFESFESSAGKFALSSKAPLSLGDDSANNRGGVLHVMNKGAGAESTAAVQLEVWNIASYPILSFSYKIPSETPVAMRVQTSFDDWICLGGTKSNQCSSTVVVNPTLLVADGNWHELQIDVKAAVETILPGMKVLKNFEFFIPNTQLVDDQFWIDDFKIMEK